MELKLGFSLHIVLAMIRVTTPEPTIHSLAWGPGLEKPSPVLPVRYFFLQAVDAAGRNITASSVDLPFQLTIIPLSGHCGIFKELLDRKDGTYIGRYRIYDQCQGLRLEVRLKDGQQITGSPWIYEDVVVHSNCDCPSQLEEWKEMASCPAGVPQIDRDLEIFQHQIPLDISKHFSYLSAQYHPQSASFCHYVIKNNLLRRKCFGEHVGFAMFMDNILLFLLRRVVFPDVNFIANLGDYPLSGNRKDLVGIVPVFSWCGQKDKFDIVMPTYDLTESSLTAMDRVSLDMLSVQASKTPSWHAKTSKGFWRGRDAREERLQLVDIGRNHPALLDAGLTNFFFFRDLEEKYGPKSPHVDFFQFFQFKYQINLDGTVAAYRFPYLLAGDSVVFKQDSDFYEHFYHDLKPWFHYIPIQRNLSDLVEKLLWAKEHDAHAEQIGKRGAEYARNNLLPHHVFCYYTLLLENWSRFAKPITQVPAGYELIRQVDGPATGCSCARSADSSGNSFSITGRDKVEL